MLQDRQQAAWSASVWAPFRLTSAAVVRVSGPDLLQQTLHGLNVAPPPGLPAVTLPPVWASDRERQGERVSGRRWRRSNRWTCDRPLMQRAAGGSAMDHKVRCSSNCGGAFTLWRVSEACAAWNFVMRRTAEVQRELFSAWEFYIIVLNQLYLDLNWNRLGPSLVPASSHPILCKTTLA